MAKDKKQGTSTDSNTKTATKTATATKTSTEAYTQGNITVTGGAGKGATTVHIGGQSSKPETKTGTSKVGSAKNRQGTSDGYMTRGKK